MHRHVKNCLDLYVHVYLICCNFADGIWVLSKPRLMNIRTDEEALSKPRLMNIRTDEG